MTNDAPPIGHNNPPEDIDPIDAALDPFADALEEATNWLDGTPVTNEAQMNAVDAVLKQIRAAGTAVNKASDAEIKPLYDTYKAELDRWKPTIADLKMQKDGLAALTNDFKKELAAEKETAKRKAYEEAQRLEREAQRKADEAVAGDIEQQREAMAAKSDAMEAAKLAAAANKDTVKGRRKVTKYDITDYQQAINDIAKNDKPALAAFVDEYVRKNHKNREIAGVVIWTEKESF